MGPKKKGNPRPQRKTTNRWVWIRGATLFFFFLRRWQYPSRRPNTSIKGKKRLREWSNLEGVSFSALLTRNFEKHEESYRIISKAVKVIQIFFFIWRRDFHTKEFVQVSIDEVVKTSSRVCTPLNCRGVADANLEGWNLPTFEGS